MAEHTGPLKSGFILYFDNYPALASLSMEQRGMVLTALFAYGDRLRRGTGEPLEEVLEQFPQLDQGARAVCLMWGGNLARDHAKWVRRVEARLQHRGVQSDPQPPARSQRSRATGPRPDPNFRRPAPQTESPFERTRQLMERWKAVEGEPEG